VAQFKRKYAARLRISPSPSVEKVERLSRRLWEFSEHVRLQALSAAAGAGAGE
jgi:hypothetical protein